ncbi:hypothetical protein SLEP1_g32890 [Rubroshorea leprosula]|uniref:Uncharacterized protein n=1 Tax=Rubroshorea leprosula TaxID=152421 RepID=A0AAV5KEU2_9ROSI|nr:hypothetical protein SLEP1_g32890 [Rubroshorea leprosula]
MLLFITRSHMISTSKPGIPKKKKKWNAVGCSCHGIVKTVSIPVATVVQGPSRETSTLMIILVNPPLYLSQNPYSHFICLSYRNTGENNCS